MRFVVNLTIIIHFAVRNKDKCIHKIFKVLSNIDNRSSGVCYVSMFLVSKLSFINLL